MPGRVGNVTGVGLRRTCEVQLDCFCGTWLLLSLNPAELGPSSSLARMQGICGRAKPQSGLLHTWARNTLDGCVHVNEIPSGCSA